MRPWLWESTKILARAGEILVEAARQHSGRSKQRPYGRAERSRLLRQVWRGIATSNAGWEAGSAFSAPLR
jgi:hypothetical protein